MITIAGSTASNCEKSCRLAPITMIDNRTPRPSTSRWRLLPFFSPVRRVGPDRLLRQRRSHHRPVYTLPSNKIWYQVLHCNIKQVMLKCKTWYRDLLENHYIQGGLLKTICYIAAAIFCKLMGGHRTLLRAVWILTYPSYHHFSCHPSFPASFACCPASSSCVPA